jgi:hypothetical protein
MDKITDAKTEFRLKQWAKIIQTCQGSGMTVVSWCNQNNVKTKSYYYWLRRIRSLACEAGSLIPQSKKQQNEQQIVQVPFRQTKASAVVTVHLSSISVEIHDGTSRETIEAVLFALKTIC